MLRLEVAASGGMPTVVRRGSGESAKLLRRTGERLRRAAHPGVVEVVRSSGDDTSWELHLAHGGRPLESLGSTTAVAAARIAAGVAETLADLHDVGVVHGRLDASHVLVAVDGRPVLCGFGPDDGGHTPADDVAAVGALLVELLGREPDPEPIPDRRWRRPRGWSGWQRRSLLLLADQACAEPASRRPTARRLAAAIADAVPDPGAASRRSVRAAPAAVAPTPVAPAPAAPAAGAPVPTPRWCPTTSEDATLRPEVQAAPRPRSAAGMVAAAAAVVLLGAGLLQVVRPWESPTTGLPAVTERGAGGHGGAGTVRVEGNVVTVGDRRYEVGEPGDIVVVGDWDCDGTDTPALLRPSTGGLFVFDQWASSSPVQVTPIRVVNGGEGLRSLEEPQGCDRLAVRRQDGTEVAVPVGGAA